MSLCMLGSLTSVFICVGGGKNDDLISATCNFPRIKLALGKVTWLDTELRYPEDRTVVDGIDDAYLTTEPPTYWMVDLNATVAIDIVFVRMSDEKHGLYGKCFSLPCYFCL